MSASSFSKPSNTLTDWYNNLNRWDAVSWLFLSLLPDDGEFQVEETLNVEFGFECLQRKFYFWIKRADMPDPCYSLAYRSKEKAVDDLIRLVLAIGNAEWESMKDTDAPSIRETVGVISAITERVRAVAEECL